MTVPVYDAVARVIVGFAVIKGTTVAIITFAIGTSFGQSLIIALTSGSLGLIGMLGAAYIAGREANKTRSKVEDVARKVGAARRATDAPPSEDE